MRIMVDIGHPAHVHFFKNFIWALENKGHKVLVTSRDKDVTISLLNAYNIKHEVLTSMGQGKGNLYKEWVIRDYKLFQIASKFNPDLLTGILNPSVAHVSWILRKKSIIFNDTEHAKIAKKITSPFSSVICTPSCYRDDIGVKQLRYNGYHELAYLHPNYFTPNPGVLKELGLNENDTFTILRFVSWAANHDFGHQGLSLDDKRKAVHEIEKYGRVFITSEKPLPDDLEKYRITLSPEKMHNLLYYATLLYGESATMASECAVLGTHAIFCDYAGRGYTDEEEVKYDLVYNFYDEKTMANESLNKAIELLKNPNLRESGKKKREALLNDKIDVTAFMVNFVESLDLSHLPQKSTKIPPIFQYGSSLKTNFPYNEDSGQIGK